VQIVGFVQSRYPPSARKPYVPTITDVKNSHQPGPCWCGYFHDVSEAMSCRARDLMRDNPKLTTEDVAHTLFDEFHELAKRDHVPDEHLRKMAMGHALQMAEIRALAK